MGIEEYEVVRDHFEARLDLGYGFPCCACKNIDHSAHEEPCRTCDHNVNAVREDLAANPAVEGRREPTTDPKKG